MTTLLRGVMSLLAAAAILVASAASAFAAQHGGVAGESTGRGGSLPFTGSERALAVIIGLGIVGSRLALRGYATRRPGRPN